MRESGECSYIWRCPSSLYVKILQSGQIAVDEVEMKLGECSQNDEEDQLGNECSDYDVSFDTDG
jgi:hypothetical protein